MDMFWFAFLRPIPDEPSRSGFALFAMERQAQVALGGRSTLAVGVDRTANPRSLAKKTANILLDPRGFPVMEL